MSYRSVAIRVLVIATALLTAAFNGGWKWDALPHWSADPTRRSRPRPAACPSFEGCLGSKDVRHW